MKATTDQVTATVLLQIEQLAASVSREAADEVGLAMVRGCVRSLRGRRSTLMKLIELLVDEAWDGPRDRLH